jgi:hypothetical protein
MGNFRCRTHAFRGQPARCSGGASESRPGLVQVLSEDLVAQLKALVADGQTVTRCGCRHARDLISTLTAEAALRRLVLAAHPPDGGDGGAGRLRLPGDHRVRAAHTTVADIDLRPGDQVPDLPLTAPAERARRRVLRGHLGHITAASPGAIRPAGFDSAHDAGGEQPRRMPGLWRHRRRQCIRHIRSITRSSGKKGSSTFLTTL